MVDIEENELRYLQNTPSPSIYLYNFELKHDFGEPDIMAVVKVESLRWSFHIALMNINRAPHCYSEMFHKGEEDCISQKWMGIVKSDLRGR